MYYTFLYTLDKSVSKIKRLNTLYYNIYIVIYKLDILIESHFWPFEHAVNFLTRPVFAIV